MKIAETGLVVYTKGEEALNVITHAAGLILPALILIKCLPHAKDSFSVVAAVLYASGTAMTFLASVIYHALKDSEAKKLFRIIDHSAIFFAVAGTVTGCTPSVFQKGFVTGAVLMLVLSWSSVIAGLLLTIFAFERFKKLRMGLYIASSAISALLGSGTYFHLPINAFLCLISGSFLLLTGCLFLKAGKTRRYMHSVFHVLVIAGLSVYFCGIYNYGFLLL